MSNSYKKKAIVKDKTNHKWYNRIFRRVNKQRVKSNKEPKLMRELINDWDVCDYKFIYKKGDIKVYKWITKEDIEIAKRK